LRSAQIFSRTAEIVWYRFMRYDGTDSPILSTLSWFLLEKRLDIFIYMQIYHISALSPDRTGNKQRLQKPFVPYRNICY
jgi:hypothetical protein